MENNTSLEWSDLARGYKKFMLNSAEHDFFLLINVKMPTIVGVLTFMSRKSGIIGLSEPDKAEFLDSSILTSISNFTLSWAEHGFCFVTSRPDLP